MGFLDDLFEGRHGRGRRQGGHYDDYGYDHDHNNPDHHNPPHDRDPYRRPGYDRDPYQQPGYDPRAVQRILVCPSCGGENPVSAKFCMECGKPLRPSGPARSDVPEPPKP